MRVRAEVYVRRTYSRRCKPDIVVWVLDGMDDRDAYGIATEFIVTS